MKILWITNTELPDAAKHFGKAAVYGGWMHQTAKLLCQDDSIELHVCSMNDSGYDEVEMNGIFYSAFEMSKCEKRISDLISELTPDVIHIWGTEYPHTLKTVECAKDHGCLSKTVISVQGLVSYISRYHYFAFLPYNVINRVTFAEFAVQKNLKQRMKGMYERGEAERKALQLAENCIGRTDWDRSCVRLINPDIRYFDCHEILRESFYKNEWKIEDCNRHSIFFSQTVHPIKGFHIMLEALHILKERYPDVKLRVIGENKNDFVSVLKEDSYKKYIKELIKKYDLSDRIEWLGTLQEKEMVREYLRCNTFVCASSIENSSNSVSEAMILGVPTVASDVGGIKSMLKHEEEGILYQADAPYMLAAGISEIFDDDELALRFSKNARARALKDHDVASNMNRLLAIYEQLEKNDEKQN